MSPLIILVGIVAFLLIFGAGVAIVVSGNRGNVDERLEEFVGTSGMVMETTAVHEAESLIQAPDMADRVDSMLSGRDFFGPIKLKIAQADLKLRVVEYMGLKVVVAVIAAIVGGIVGGGLLLAVVGGVVGFNAPSWYISSTGKKRIRAFNDQLSDSLNLWVNALRSGYSVLQSMEAIATEMPPPVSKEFERVVQEVRLGLPVHEGLANMLRRVPSEDLDLVITAVNIQREVGGNLAEILETISYTIRERVRIKGEINTLTSQGRISGYVISFLPIGLSLVLYLINKPYVEQLWEREPPYFLADYPCGWLMLGISLLMIFFGWLAIQKVVNIEV